MTVSAGTHREARLDGRVVLVTGALGAIGSTTAQVLASRGARLILADSDVAGLQRCAASLRERGATAEALPYDADDAAELGSLITAAVASSRGGLDGVVAASGRAPHVPLDRMDPDRWERSAEARLRHDAALVAAAAPRLGAGGAVVLIAPSVAHGGGPHGQIPYITTGAGLSGLARAASRELAASGVRINAVLPGYVDTAVGEGLFSPDERREKTAATPLGALAEPIDVALAAAFLVGPESRSITGQHLVVDGGRSAA